MIFPTNYRIGTSGKINIANKTFKDTEKEQNLKCHKRII